MRNLISDSRPKLDCRLAACAVALALCFFAVTKVEGAMTEEERFEKGLIEVHYPPDYLAPYKERRSSWAPVVGMNYANVAPVGFLSDFAADDNSDRTFESIFGSAAMPMFSFYGGVQFNFSGFSVAPTLGMTEGSLSGGLDSTTLKVSTRSAGILVNLDAIMNEPYVVPTFHFAVNTASYSEQSAFGSISDATTPFMSYSIGALVQLNWLDPESAFESLKESGINNTFVHIFGGQFLASGGASTSLASNMALGLGVRLEF